MSAASRMLSAISFGVFCRLAPSTIEIMRSRNVSPGSAATLTMSQSERTRVPATTALRSPPASRMTGALSPVIAASLTDATPSTMSPSHGTSSSASMRTMSPLRSTADDTISTFASRFASASFFAGVSLRACRSVSACAFPRPSAIASAKLAKSTVNHSQSETAKMKPAEASPCPPSAWTKSAVVKDAPDLDDEHDRVLELMARVELSEGVDHGALHDRPLEQLSRRGLPPEGGVRRWRRCGGNELDRRPGGRLRLLRFRLGIVHRESSGPVREQVLDDGAQRERGNERERADDDDRADEHRDEERIVGRERPLRFAGPSSSSRASPRSRSPARSANSARTTCRCRARRCRRACWR